MPTTITIDMLKSLVKSRPEDGHKGTFGHALLMAGSYGMAGAGVLAGRGCMRSGVGKLTVHIPWRNNDIMQIALPRLFFITTTRALIGAKHCSQKKPFPNSMPSV